MLVTLECLQRSFIKLEKMSLALSYIMRIGFELSFSKVCAGRLRPGKYNIIKPL